MQELFWFHCTTFVGKSPNSEHSKFANMMTMMIMLYCIGSKLRRDDWPHWIFNLISQRNYCHPDSFNFLNRYFIHRKNSSYYLYPPAPAKILIFKFNNFVGIKKIKVKFTISLRLETRRYERISDEDWWHLKFISIRLSIDYRLHCVVRFDWMNLSEKIESIIELQTSLLNKCRIVHYDWLEIHWTSSTTNNRCFFHTMEVRFFLVNIFTVEHFVVGFLLKLPQSAT